MELKTKIMATTFNDDFKKAGIPLEAGYGNGYVGVPKGHELYGVNYTEIGIEAHGGLTFSDKFRDDNYWYLGFDTLHYGDNSINFNKEYVEKEIEALKQRIINKEYTITND